MAKAAKRKAQEVTTPQAPEPDTAPEPSAFERMRELTRRIVNVPKSELPPTKPNHDPARLG